MSKLLTLQNFTTSSTNFTLKNHAIESTKWFILFLSNFAIFFLGWAASIAIFTGCPYICERMWKYHSPLIGGLSICLLVFLRLFSTDRAWTPLSKTACEETYHHKELAYKIKEADKVFRQMLWGKPIEL